MKLVVDSNIFIGGVDPRDALHQQCLPIVERIVTGEIEALCPVLVLVETTCALRRDIRPAAPVALRVSQSRVRFRRPLPE